MTTPIQTPEIAPQPGAAVVPPRHRRRARRPSGTLVAGLALVAAFAAAALLAPWLAPADPTALLLERRLEPPSPGHPLGFDELGRDVLSRLLFGARASLAVALAVVGLAATLGTALGAVAGYRGGRVDGALMRATDVFLAFPGILLAIALVAVLGPGLGHVVLALVAFGWVDYARLARGQVLQVREADYVAAARVAGVRGPAIVWRHVLPNVLPTLLVQASLGMAGAIIAESALSFLGLGLRPPTPSWGGMIDAGRGHLVDAPHLAVFPGLALFAVVLGLNLLADGLGDRLGRAAPRSHADPKRAL